MSRITQFKTYVLYPLSLFLVFSVWIGALWAVDIDPNQAWVWAVGILVVIALVTLLGVRAGPSSVGEGVKIGIAWAIVFILVDVLTIPFLAGWGYFADWRAYIHYPVPVLIVPVIAHLRSSQSSNTGKLE